MSMRALGGWALAGLISVAAAAGQPDTVPTLTADQIVEKNVAARGGLEAWRKIQTMVWTGRIETGKPSAATVAFVLEYKRPNKMRFETRADHEQSARVFDGAAGWKTRTSASGAATLKRYSRSELRSARDAQGIGGLLIDHQARGIEVALEGPDEVDGHRAYRLAVTLPSGSTRHVWVDAQTFLDLKYEREGRAPGGRTGTVSVFYRDWRAIDGLQIPTTTEARAAGGNAAERMVIDNVTLNPSLSDAHFERPNAPERRKAQPGLRSASPAGDRAPRYHVRVLV
jgi:outer membrane lipoprotein-sorting protein